MRDARQAGYVETNVNTLCMRDLHRAHIPLYGEERLEVARQLKLHGRTEDRNKLVLSCVRWALKIAHRYRRFYPANHLFMDLVQEGMTGLVIAADKYDPEHAAGASFSTYSSDWIKQRITRFLVNQLEAVRLPTNVAQKVALLRRVAIKLEMRLGRRPTDEEIISEGFDPKDLRSIRKNPFGGVVSLEEPIDNEHSSGGETRTLGDVIATDKESLAFASMIVNAEAKQATFRFLKYKFGEKKATIIALRYGLLGDEPMTLEDVGVKFNVTRERIRQIESKVLKSPAFRWFVTSNFRIAERRLQPRPRSKPETTVSPKAAYWPKHIAIVVERTEIFNNGHGSRDVVRCGECNLVQYLPKSMHCRKCNIEFRLVDRVEVRISAAIVGFYEPEQPQEIPINAALVESIGRRIRMLREARGMTQSRLQELSRVSRSYLSRIESGQMTPSLGTLEKIGEPLGVGLSTFFAPKKEADQLALVSDPFINSLREHLPDLQPHQLFSLLECLKAIQPPSVV